MCSLIKHHHAARRRTNALVSGRLPVFCQTRRIARGLNPNKIRILCNSHAGSPAGESQAPFGAQNHYFVQFALSVPFGLFGYRRGAPACGQAASSAIKTGASHTVFCRSSKTAAAGNKAPLSVAVIPVPVKVPRTAQAPLCFKPLCQ